MERMNTLSKGTWLRKYLCALMMCFLLATSVQAETLPPTDSLTTDPTVIEQMGTEPLPNESTSSEEATEELSTIGQKNSYALFFLVSDYGREGHILNEATLKKEYALTLMSVASALKERGQLDALGISATQLMAATPNAEPFMIEDLSNAPAALYHFMHTAQPSFDGMSGNTGIDIRAVLNYCKERELRPFIVIVYGNDLRQFNETLRISDPASKDGILLYLHGGTPIKNIERLDDEWDGDLLELSADQLNTMLTAPFEDITAEWSNWISQEGNQLSTLKNDVAHELLLIVRADSKLEALNPDDDYSILSLPNRTYLLSMTPHSALTLNQNVTIEQVYCRESKSATQQFNTYCEQVNTALSALTAVPFSLDLPIDSRYTLQMQLLQDGTPCSEEFLQIHQNEDSLHIEALSSVSGVYQFEVTVEMNGLTRTISSASLLSNRAPALKDEYALMNEYAVGSFPFQPDSTMPYARIELTELFYDADGDLLTFLLDGVSSENTYVELMADASLSHFPAPYEMTVQAVDAHGNQSAPLKLTWEFTAPALTEAPEPDATTPEATTAPSPVPLVSDAPSTEAPAVPKKTSSNTLLWIIVGIVLVVLGAPMAFLLIRNKIRSSRVGYVYELVLHGHARAYADAAQWHGHPVTLRELMRLSGIRPLNRQNARQLEQVTLCAETNGYFTVNVSTKCGLQIESTDKTAPANQYQEVTLISQNPNNPFRLTIAFLKRSDDPYDLDSEIE